MPKFYTHEQIHDDMRRKRFQFEHYICRSDVVVVSECKYQDDGLCPRVCAIYSPQANEGERNLSLETTSSGDDLESEVEDNLGATAPLGVDYGSRE